MKDPSDPAILAGVGEDSFSESLSKSLDLLVGWEGKEKFDLWFCFVSIVIVVSFNYSIPHPPWSPTRGRDDGD